MRRIAIIFMLLPALAFGARAFIQVTREPGLCPNRCVERMCLRLEDLSVVCTGGWTCVDCPDGGVQ